MVNYYYQNYRKTDNCLYLRLIINKMVNTSSRENRKAYFLQLINGNKEIMQRKNFELNKLNK